VIFLTFLVGDRQTFLADEEGTMALTDEAEYSETRDLTRGEATLLSSQAGDPRAAAGDTTDAGQTLGVDRRPENQPSRSDVAVDHGADDDSTAA
jgi:hypothetical protein